VCGVADQRELGFANRRRCLMPHLVRKMCIGGHDVNLCTCFLEFCIVVSSVFDLCGAIESESGWHENQNRPFAFECFVGHLNKLAVVKGLCFEWLNLRVDERHGGFLFWLNKTIE